MRQMWLAVLVLVGACGDAQRSPADQAVPPPPPRFTQASADPAEHGERLSRVLGCTGCHNDNLTGNDWSEPEYGTLWSSNLTRSATRWSAAELTQMITAGKRPDRALMEMPSALFAQLHPDDVAALVTYLKTLEPTGLAHPEPTIGPQLAKEIAAGEYRDSAQQVADHAGKGPPDLGPDHALGRLIVGATCAECHGTDLRGKAAPAPDAKARPDLRMVASYSATDFAALMGTGKAAGNREVGLMSTVARRRYSSFTDAEVAAVQAYLNELAARDP